MATASDLIGRAYRLANIVGREAVVSAREVSDGLSALNEMLDYWRASEQIDLGLFDVAASDTIPREVFEPLRYNLALRLADEVGLDVSAVTFQKAEQMKADLRNPVIPDLEIDSALLPRRYYNITRGY
jgi:hypothetical protein